MSEATITGMWDAVIAALEAGFPGISVFGEEVAEGVPKPYFFVGYKQGNQEQELGRRYRRKHVFDVQFFGTNNRDMLGTAEQVYRVLETIGTSRGTSMRHEIADRVLHVYVEYSFLVWQPRTEEPVMETMEQTGGVK